jgi:hypothetical protein
VKGGRASRKLYDAPLLRKSRILAPRSHLKFLYLYLIVGVLHGLKIGAIDTVVAVFGLESHRGCFLCLHTFSRCRSEARSSLQQIQPQFPSLLHPPKHVPSSPASASLSFLAIIPYAISAFAQISRSGLIGPVNCEM